MFTGIVQFVYKIKVSIDNKCVYLYPDIKFLYLLSIGDSVAVDGICLTVVQIEDTYCMFQLSDETISKTALSCYSEKLANIELPIKFGSFVGGHIMSGHIHQTGILISRSDNGDLWIDLQSDAKKLTRYKGSIAINGISLTVAEIKDTMIRLCLIPETINRTNLGSTNINDKLNIEFD
jgi:riboflavin synthase